MVRRLRQRRGCSAMGVTALELLVGAGILAIIAAASFPLVAEALLRYRFEAAVGQVVGHLRDARSLAVARRAIHGVHFGTDVAVSLPNSYRVERSLNGAGTTWPAPASGMATDGSVLTNWQNLATQYAGVTIASVTDSAAQPIGIVLFDSQGAARADVAGAAAPFRVRVSGPGGRGATIQVATAGGIRVQ